MPNRKIEIPFDEWRTKSKKYKLAEYFVSMDGVTEIVTIQKLKNGRSKI